MKTARSLGISKAELDALVDVRDGLASGRYKHMKAKDLDKASRKPVFSMDRVCDPTHRCGTIGCIGGWVGLKLGKDISSTDDYVYSVKGKLNRLYFPSDVIAGWEKITPKQAAQAITNFLETGKPNWEEVVPHLCK